MIEIVIETKIKGVWTRYETATERFMGDPEDAFHRAKQIVAECIVDNHWPGGELRAQWDEGGPEVFTLLTNDPCLDDYIVEARENQRQYIEAQRHLFRSAE